MVNGIGASLAGLAAFEKRSLLAANNIANSNTAGYKKTEATITEDAAGLPEVNLQRIDTPGPLVPEEDGTLGNSLTWIWLKN